MAVGILVVIVISVTGAITAGQQHAYEAHQRIAATLAAEELMGRIVASPYADLLTWNGYTEAPGEMTTADGGPFPDTFAGVGRDVEITSTLQVLSNPAVTVRGRSVRVRSQDRDGRVLADLQRFIPEPPSTP